MFNKKQKKFLKENAGNIFYPIVIIVSFVFYMLGIAVNNFEVGYAFLILYSAGMVLFEPFKSYFRKHSDTLHWVVVIFIGLLSLGIAMFLLGKIVIF